MNNYLYIDFIDSIDFSLPESYQLTTLKRMLNKVYNKNIVKKNINQFKLDRLKINSLKYMDIEVDILPKSKQEDLCLFKEYLSTLPNTSQIIKEKIKFITLIASNNYKNKKITKKIQLLLYQDSFDRIASNIGDNVKNILSDVGCTRTLHNTPFDRRHNHTNIHDWAAEVGPDSTQPELNILLFEINERITQLIENSRRNLCENNNCEFHKISASKYECRCSH